MSDQKIVRMHVTSDRADELGLLHLSSFKPEPVGTVETIDGKQYRVIDNWQTTIVTYEPIEEDDNEN